MLDLERVRELAAKETGLAVAVTLRPDGTPHGSVVNAGVLRHPVTGAAVVAFVARGGVRKLVYLRDRPAVTLVWRTGWDWIAVDGHSELVGPQDSLDGFNPDDLPLLIRAAYAASAGGSPEEWADLDDEIAEEGHTAVLVTPSRIYSNAPDASAG